jgi:hypothetical protein
LRSPPREGHRGTPHGNPRAEVVRLAIALRADRSLALDRHPADRIGGHRDHVREGAVLEPQDPIGDVADALVVADDDDAPPLLLRDPPEQPRDLVADLRVEVRRRLVGQDERCR